MGRALALSGVIGLAAWGGVAQAGAPLRIESEPSGAEIRIDGASTGLRTPASLEGVTPGPHIIALRDGCERGEAVVDVSGAPGQVVWVPMSTATGTLIIQPEPPEAEVSIDGSPLTGEPGAPFPVPCGAHRLRLSLDGYAPTLLTIDIGVDELITLPVALTALGEGQVVITVNPERARVSLDGRAIGAGSRELSGVVAGPHHLRAELDGFAPAEAEFVLEADATIAMDLRLTPMKAPRARPSGAHVAGYSLSAIGVGMLGFAVINYATHLDEWRTYQAMGGDVRDGTVSRDTYTDYYTEQLRPAHRASWIGGAGGGALLVTGATLLIAF